MTLDIQRKSNNEELAESKSPQNLNDTLNADRPTNFARFDIDYHMESDSNMTNSEISKYLEMDDLKYKKSTDPVS